MSRRTLSAMILVAIFMSCTLGWAQEPAQDPRPEPKLPVGKTFKLLRGDESAASDLDLEDEEVEAWVPGLKSGTIEVSLGVGFMSLNTTLLKHDQLIYKFTTESTFWGDVEISGASAFAPSLRVGYNLTNWFSFEGWSGVSISEYSSKITNTSRRKNEPDAPVIADPPVGEFDEETRSLITLQAGLNAVLYPLAIGGDGLGRWHPFVTAGAGNMWYNMNSNFTEGTATAFDVNFGIGMRLLVDRNIAVRAEVLLHRNELEWTPAEYYTELNEGTTRVPLNEFPVLEDGTIDEHPVESFSANTISALHWMIGVQGSF